VRRFLATETPDALAARLAADGRIVSLLFDGNIHSISGAYWLDAEKNRAIAVHPAIIREALLGVSFSSTLVDERLHHGILEVRRERPIRRLRQQDAHQVFLRIHPEVRAVDAAPAERAFR
jgi:hypothetical protein